MRNAIFLVFLLPLIAVAQFNRSATELAKEKIKEYLTAKIFKSQSYRPISYGEIKSMRARNSDVAWTIIHKFELEETSSTSKDQKTSDPKAYQFIFYFDEKMRVLKAVSF